ncbi:murein L,D-transpeptidase [Sphingosinicella sp. BN140058]|uniref:L,D-transpeptidase family protein n=1 Tax=Sphingosinicella sp. BN140058 TaxID=1892855 RepID=UPI00101120E7|nr:L,D-transpeptidase family protein [Sphingosinicella sp. BN140058]QAY75750.1 murein L,D-transpeptidase [Sphingosinicella sp. BN140058]
MMDGRKTRRSAARRIALAAALLVASHAALQAPLQAASPSVLEAEVRSSSDRTVRQLYAARGYAPLWTEGSRLSDAAEAVLARLETADADGLDPRDYQVRRLRSAFDDANSSKGAARAEVQLSRGFLKYARDLRRSRAADMTYVDAALIPTAPSPGATLDRAAGAAGKPASLSEALGTHPLYEQLREAYLLWSERWGDLPQTRIAEGPPLRSGMRGERVQDLRMRLGLSPGDLFDVETGAAVRAFQASHGLAGNGIADKPTIALLNTGPRDFAAKLRLNLERARALPSMADRYVLVDAAAQRLWMYQGGRPVDSMKVIVGRVTEPTPMLAAYIRFAVLNPYWNVPPDLVQSRVAPKVLSQGLGYIRAERYQILSDWSDDAKPVDAKTIDWRAVARGEVEVPMRQLPGPKNSMGNMKFMFPNQFGVYLHDTPDKRLFGAADRKQSAGCVRVEDARRLARWLFGRVPTAKSAAPEQQVPLKSPVPVYITYLTAAPTGSGIAIREDIYGRDGEAGLRLAGRR